MKNVVAAVNSSIQFNKKNFWIDPIGGNQYFVGVQYPEGDIKSIETLLNIPITGKGQQKAIPLSNLITLRRKTAEEAKDKSADCLELIFRKCQF